MSGSAYAETQMIARPALCVPRHRTRGGADPMWKLN
jgi:hypothetical protein